MANATADPYASTSSPRRKANAPKIQAAYWVGGYQASDTTVSITDSTKNYVSGMIQLNTTTGEYVALSAPFTPVQEGALTYIPNAWNYVQIYDIAGGKWYNQSTTGTAPSRTQFCAVVQRDEASPTSYLSILSFKRYKASSLNTGRITLDCAAYGSQIFGVGGRLAWADDSGAGCYDMPAFIYDAQSQTVKAEFDSPYPSSWADPGLGNLFLVDQNSTSSTNSTASKINNSHTSNKRAIAGGVVGGLVGLALIMALIYYARQHARKKRVESEDLKIPPRTKIGELEDSVKWSELRTKTNTRTELHERFVERYEFQDNPVRRYELH
ncbi:uncharacterized protein N7473_004012 [Penicillium subrubescens]|uniref:uncharacterized protein n=1 Tax=Penicillium subrubescens TaxID=1316194 RepID=UPI002545A695|nr:uncharacterized protein N7473_004012 [Penicillium subrubescens]KAJ5907096.1 hypothetical protein N7473_004012 [Penicillium subrubescens]